MDKKIILVLLILLVLAIYYCYTHESFTENFETVADSTKGPLTVNGNLILTPNKDGYGNINIGNKDVFAANVNGLDAYINSKKTFVGDLQAGDLSLERNIKIGTKGTKPSYIIGGGDYLRFGIEDKDVFTVSAGDSYLPYIHTNKINAGGKDLLAEIEALKAGAAGNASKGGTDTNKAITDLGNIAAQLLAGGNVTVPGNLTLQTKGQNINMGMTDNGYFKIQGGDKEMFVFHVNGTETYIGGTNVHVDGNINSTTLNAANLKLKPDNRGYGSFKVGDTVIFTANASGGDAYIASKKLYVDGRDILAELDDLKRNVVRKDAQYYFDIGSRVDGFNTQTDKGVIVHGDGYANIGPMLMAWNKNSTTRFTLRQA